MLPGGGAPSHAAARLINEAEDSKWTTTCLTHLHVSPHLPSQGCGAANRRRLVAVHCDRAASFETVHGLLNRLMEVLSVPYTGA